MILARSREAGDFVAACLGAVLVAGLIYVGVLLLNDAPLPDHMEVAEGAIRLAQPVRDEPKPELQRKKLEDTKPPEQLRKTFTTQTKSKPAKPLMSMATPQFSADLHPSLQGGVALPSGDFGGIGFSLDEVDEIPQVVRSITPEYPYMAKRSRIEGRVVVRMLVTAKGATANLSIHSATPADVFDKAALNAAKRYRFQPGKYKGQPVDTWVLLPFVFELTL